MIVIAVTGGIIFLVVILCIIRFLQEEQKISRISGKTFSERQAEKTKMEEERIKKAEEKEKLEIERERAIALYKWYLGVDNSSVRSLILGGYLISKFKYDANGIRTPEQKIDITEKGMELLRKYYGAER